MSILKEVTYKRVKSDTPSLPAITSTTATQQAFDHTLDPAKSWEAGFAKNILPSIPSSKYRLPPQYPTLDSPLSGDTTSGDLDELLAKFEFRVFPINGIRMTRPRSLLASWASS